MFLQKFFLPVPKVNLCGSYEGDPLSPPKGEATQGEHPLDPLTSEILIIPQKPNRSIGGCPAVAEARSTGFPKSNSGTRISPKTDLPSEGPDEAAERPPKGG